MSRKKMMKRSLLESFIEAQMLAHIDKKNMQATIGNRQDQQHSFMLS
jgi:hypothetical protein